MSSDIKNDLINWNAEQLSDDSPVYNSKDLINALNSIMPSLGSVILTTNNHVLSKQEDWDSITMNTLNMFTTLANSGLPASDFPNNSGILLVLGYTSYNIYIAISGTAVYYRLGDADWNKLLTSETIKDLTGSVATLTNNLSKLSDQQTTLNSLFNTFKDDTNKQLDTLNTQSTSQAKLLEDIKTQLQEGLAELSKQIVVGDNIEIGKDVTTENENAIVNIISQLDPNNFNIGFITDNHGGICSWTSDYSDKYAYDHLNNFLKLDGNVDVMIAGGDNSDCYRPSDQAIVVDNRRFDTQFLFSTDNLSDKFILKGNHDDGSLRTNDYRRGARKFETVPHVLRDSEFNKMIAADQLLFNEKRNNGKSYFYKDYPNKKVRVIGLNSNDTPDDILLDDGEPKYLGIWRMGYRQEQLNWLANVALQNVPEDYVTIIFSHIQADIPSYENDENYANHDTHRNQDILNQIIKDFMAGSSSSLTSDYEDYKINLKTNFVTQGKRNFAGYIHGHEHAENATTDLGFNNIGFFASYNVARVYIGDTDAWQTISIDQTNRKLIIKGFGRATNRTFSY